MITIYCDFQQLKPILPDVLVAASPGDYVPVRQAIRRALSDASILVVVVRSPILAGWLSDLRDYARDVVCWETADLRRDFVERFGFEAPAVFDDQALAEIGILDLPQPTTVPANPAGWLLGYCLGAVWEVQTPYASHLAQLVAWATSHDRPVHDALRLLQGEQLKTWGASHPAYAYLAAGNLVERARTMLCRWALRRYPKAFLAEIGLATVPATDCTGYNKATIRVLEGQAEALRRYWGVQAACLETEPATFVRITLEQISGLSALELTTLGDYLIKHPETIATTVLDRIRVRFQHLPQTPAVLKELERLVSPPIPTPPERDWTVQRWLNWTTEEYMPYFAWIIRAGQPREQQMALADRFADWFTEQCSQLQFDRDAPFLTHQQELVRRLAAESPHIVLIWVIVDGLTWWQGQMLLEACVVQGLHAHAKEAWLSALPSVTSVSKRALAMGYLSAPDHRQPVTTLLAERLTDLVGSVRVFPEIEALSECLTGDIDPGLYVALYNSLDAHNHESCRFTDDEATLGHLRKLAHHLAEGARHCEAEGKDVFIVISSDHGSTLLPANTVILHPPSFAEFLEDEDDTLVSGRHKAEDVRHTRACSVRRELTVSDLEALSSRWYVLSRDVFGLPQTFLMPKGYACVQRRPRGWTHGGATPEETVVPFLQLRLKPMEVIPPTVQMTGFLLPNRPSSLALELTNPNACPLWNVRVLAWDGQMAAAFGEVAAHKLVSITLQAPQATARERRQEIEWFVTWEVLGQVRQASGMVSLPVRRFQVSHADELFEGIA